MLPIEERQVLAAGAGAFEGDDMAIEGEELAERPLIRWRFPKEALLAGVAPAGVDAGLGFDPSDLPVKGLGEKLESLVACPWV